MSLFLVLLGIIRCFDILCSFLDELFIKSSFCFSCDSSYTDHDNTLTCLIVPMSLINITGFPPLREFKQRHFSAHVRRLSQLPRSSTCVGGNAIELR